MNAALLTMSRQIDGSHDEEERQRQLRRSLNHPAYQFYIHWPWTDACCSYSTAWALEGRWSRARSRYGQLLGSWSLNPLYPHAWGVEPPMSDEARFGDDENLTRSPYVDQLATKFRVLFMLDDYSVLLAQQTMSGYPEADVLRDAMETIATLPATPALVSSETAWYALGYVQGVLAGTGLCHRDEIVRHLKRQWVFAHPPDEVENLRPGEVDRINRIIDDIADDDEEPDGDGASDEEPPA